MKGGKTKTQTLFPGSIEPMNRPENFTPSLDPIVSTHLLSPWYVFVEGGFELVDFFGVEVDIVQEIEHSQQYKES